MKSIPSFFTAARHEKPPAPRLSTLHAWRCASEACRDGLLVDGRCLALRREVVDTMPAPARPPSQPSAYS